MKVSELTGAQLDCWVAKANGFKEPYIKNDTCFVGQAPYIPGRLNYSTDWLLGGPIIQRERIAIEPFKDTLAWSAFKFETGDCDMASETPLIAAMRCYVASKFGDEVPDEIDN